MNLPPSEVPKSNPCGLPGKVGGLPGRVVQKNIAGHKFWPAKFFLNAVSNAEPDDDSPRPHKWGTKVGASRFNWLICVLGIPSVKIANSAAGNSIIDTLRLYYIYYSKFILFSLIYTRTAGHCWAGPGKMSNLPATSHTGLAL